MKGKPDSNLALKIDIFGMGMLFYYLVFGEYPFKKNELNNMTLIDMILIDDK